MSVCVHVHTYMHYSTYHAVALMNHLMNYVYWYMYVVCGVCVCVCVCVCACVCVYVYVCGSHNHVPVHGLNLCTHSNVHF